MFRSVENIGETCRRASGAPRDLTVDQELQSFTITLRLATTLIGHFILTITGLVAIKDFLQLISSYSLQSIFILHSVAHKKQRSHVAMPRKCITVVLELRVTCTIMHTNVSTLAPLPVEESEVESAAEDVLPTKAEVAKTNDESADATMKDEVDEEDDGDEEDPETSV